MLSSPSYIVSMSRLLLYLSGTRQTVASAVRRGRECGDAERKADGGRDEPEISSRTLYDSDWSVEWA